MRHGLRRRFLIHVSYILFTAAAGLSAAQAVRGADQKALPTAQLEQNTVPAAGSHSTLMKASRFGRYSILVSSPQGTALQLVDRMAGPGEISGLAGEQDGRLDVFLERGEYKIVTYGHERASGTAEMALHPFVEQNLPQPPLLPELKTVEKQLRDFEQLSYWLDIQKRSRVILEAAGRSLADLRLWKDGNWLMDIRPELQILYPKHGQPLLSCRLTAELDPGMYLLTAYGGPAQPWSEESESHPFYLRSGIPRLGSAGRQRLMVSPFGQDRYLVPGETTYFRLELPEATDATLEVTPFSPDSPFDQKGNPSKISKESRTPVAEVTARSSANSDHIVTVSAEAGQPYILQQFEFSYQYSLKGSGDYWLSSIHSGPASDSIDATAIGMELTYQSREHVEPLFSQTVEIGNKTYWERRFNLLEQANLFLHINDQGSYQLLCREGEVRYRIEPFFVNRPAQYRTPPAKSCGETWDLDPGYHVLTLTPEKKGIVHLILRPLGLFDRVLDTVGWERSLEKTPLHTATRFPAVHLDRNNSYIFYLNRQPEVKAGIQLRKLPLDLTESLFIVQEPGETASIPFKVTEPGTLRSRAENGEKVELSLDGGPGQTEIPVEPGSHTVTVHWPGTLPVQYSLLVVPRALETRTPLPSVSPERLEALPEFPTIDDQSARYGDLLREQSATFLVKADKPALYRIQSTGLLATSGNLRSRTNPSFARESQNGIGRNFSLQQYLREGDYQVSIKAEGKSTGHFGLELVRTPIQNGGFLRSGIAARATLEPGQAIAFHFIITEPGEFRLRALGEGHTFRCRLEDEDGWPLLPPGVEADTSRYYPPGRYRMVVLPEVTTRRVVAVIGPVSQPRRFDGHGPHTLHLAEQIDHIWMEPEGNDPRTPDRWDFTAVAPLEALIRLTGEMQGNLLRLDADGKTEPVAFIPPGRGWKGILSAGRYRIETMATRRNNRAPYQLSIQPTELVAGLSREVEAPVSIPVSVGEAGLLEFSSFGSDDVQARLFDESGRMIAASDDRPDDWNFQITRTLQPGRYRLEVDPAGTSRASTTVRMVAPPEDLKPELSLPARLEITLGEAVRLYPLPVFSSPVLFSAAVTSDENIGLALEALQENGWQTLDGQSDKSPGIRIPLGDPDEDKAISYRLRLWSLDRRATRIKLHVQAAKPKAARENQLASGIAVSGRGADSMPPPYRITLDRPGLFRTQGVHSGICWSAGDQEPCLPAGDGMVIAWSRNLWVASTEPVDSKEHLQIRAERIRSAEQIEFPMRTLGEIRYDLPAGQGRPLLVLASSPEGQPAVQLAETNREQAEFVLNSAVAPRAAVSVLLSPKAPCAWIWPATPESGGVNVRLQTYAFPAAQPAPGEGTWNGTVRGIQSSGFSLDKGVKRFRLTMGNSMVAVLSKGDRIENVLWQGGDPFNASVESDADLLTMLHTRQEEDPYAVEILPLREENFTNAISPEIPFEQTFVQSGIVRLSVPALSGKADPASTLHIRGTVESVTFMGKDGAVSHEKDIPLPPGGGMLDVAYNPGLVLCWLDLAGEEMKGLWPETGLPDAVPADLPSIHSLDGTIKSFKIRAEKPILLHIRMASPSITRLERGSGKPEIEVHPDGTLMETYVPQGEAHLSFRAVGESSLFDSVEFTAAPATSIGEGLGPEVLLAPGDSRLFSFEVKTEGPVGIGIQASSDLVESVLISSQGEILSSGTAQILNLKPGTYLLALKAPARGKPIHARPAVVGIVPPGQGPPEEIIRQYLQAPGADGEFAE